MRTNIRFRKAFDAYPQGSRHWLPDELAAMYVNAGVAEVVGVEAPVPVEVVEPPESTETPAEEDDKPTPRKRKKS